MKLLKSVNISIMCNVTLNIMCNITFHFSVSFTVPDLLLHVSIVTHTSFLFQVLVLFGAFFYTFYNKFLLFSSHLTVILKDL